MRMVRTGLLVAWFALIVSLFWDPLTPALTRPGNVGSPFHITGTPTMMQGKPMMPEPYPMGNRIFWTMVLPLVPLTLMLLGHETWRRICPLSHFSQVPGMLGWQRKVSQLNRASGRVDRLLALVPGKSWLSRNGLYFQFGFLAVGVLGRTLFYNSDRMAFAAATVSVLMFALIIGFIYGGKTWCNYFCPVSVIQMIYTGPGGIFDSKAHVAPTAVSQSVCRTPDPNGDRSACVGCITNCRDVDLENAYWRNVESDQKRFVYYGFFGLVFAFYTYYYVYSGSWSYYMTGYWTHEEGQLSMLGAPGLYGAGFAVPIPKFIAAPLYFALCIAVAYWLFAFAERLYVRWTVRRGKTLSKARLRHQALTVCAFLTFNVFYLFAGRPNILLMPSWVAKLIDTLIVFLSVLWLFRSLARDADLYRHERLARSLRDQLTRMGFHPEEALDGAPLDQLSADEVYVLAKTLPNFTAAQKREAYRAVLVDALESGHAQTAESLTILGDLRAQLGLSDAEHHAIVDSLGIDNPALLDPHVPRSMERQACKETYREVLVEYARQGIAAGVDPSAHLACPQVSEAVEPVRALLNISDDDHARIAGDVAHDDSQLVESAKRAVRALRQLESARFSLSFDQRAEARLLRHGLRDKQKVLIREIASQIASISERRTARSLAQSIHTLVGNATDVATQDVMVRIPDEIRDAFHRTTGDPVLCSYLDVIEAAVPVDEVFREFVGDLDPMIAAVAVVASPGDGFGETEMIAAKLLERAGACTPVIKDMLAGARPGVRSDIIAVMAALLAVDVFAALDLRTLAHIAGRSTVVTFAAGDQIFRPGDTSESMYVVIDGEAQAWIDGEGGRRVLSSHQVGAVFGELGVFTGQPHAASVEIVSASAAAVVVAREVIDELLARDQFAARQILAAVSGQLLDTLSVDAAPRGPKIPEAALPAR